MFMLIYIMDNREIEGIKSMLNNEEYEDEIFCGYFEEECRYFRGTLIYI